MNTKYGRLTNGRIEYAPISLDTGDGVKMNPSEASYLAAGWKKVVDVRPTTEPGCRVEVSGWNESEDTLTCVYKVVAGETPSGGARVFSKLKLVAALKEADKWVLVKTWIEGIPRRARCARRVAVGSGERVARTAKQPQGPARGKLRSNFARGVRGALARPYETSALSQSLVSVGFPLRRCRRPSKRFAFFGGYAIKGYARMTDEQAEAILSKCIYEE